MTEPNADQPKIDAARYLADADYRREIDQQEREPETGAQEPDGATTYALDWLATRLHRHITDPTSDWNVARTWDESHWLKLKAALEPVDPLDHKTIDKTFADYARANRLLDNSFLAAREARIKKEHRYGYDVEENKALIAREHDPRVRALLRRLIL